MPETLQLHSFVWAVHCAFAFMRTLQRVLSEIMQTLNIVCIVNCNILALSAWPSSTRIFDHRFNQYNDGSRKPGVNQCQSITEKGYQGEHLADDPKENNVSLYNVAILDWHLS